MSNIVTYANILHDFGIGSKEALQFKAAHKHNKKLIQRCEVLEMLMRLGRETPPPASGAST